MKPRPDTTPHLKLIGYVHVGLAVALAFFCLLMAVIAEPIRAASGRSPESQFGIAYYVMVPLALFVGSGLTGFLCSPYIKTTLGLVWVSPGLYLSLAGAGIMILHWHPASVVPLLQLQVLWFLASWAGVGAGHLVSWSRSRASK